MANDNKHTFRLSFEGKVVVLCGTALVVVEAVSVFVIALLAIFHLEEAPVWFDTILACFLLVVSVFLARKVYRNGYEAEAMSESGDMC